MGEKAWTKRITLNNSGPVPDLRVIFELRHQAFYWEEMFYKPGSNHHTPTLSVKAAGSLAPKYDDLVASTASVLHDDLHFPKTDIADFYILLLLDIQRDLVGIRL